MSRSFNTEAVAEALAQSPIFERLDPAERLELVRASRLIRCEGRTTVLAAGAPHTHLFYVIAGQIDYGGAAIEGDEITLAVFGPGRTSSWLSMFHKAPEAKRTLSAVAGPAVLAIPNSAMRAVLDRRPELYPLVMEFEARRFRALLDWQQQSLVSDRCKRIALLLALLVEASGESGPHPTVRLTGEKLARSAQCSRQTLAVAMRRLTEAGLIQQGYGFVRILDISALRAFAA